MDTFIDIAELLTPNLVVPMEMAYASPLAADEPSVVPFADQVIERVATADLKSDPQMSPAETVYDTSHEYSEYVPEEPMPSVSSKSAHSNRKRRRSDDKWSVPMRVSLPRSNRKVESYAEDRDMGRMDSYPDEDINESASKRRRTTIQRYSPEPQLEAAIAPRRKVRQQSSAAADRIAKEIHQKNAHLDIKERKRLERLAKNREGAHQFRLRQKMYVASLEEQNRTLEGERVRLHNRIRYLESENAKLLDELDARWDATTPSMATSPSGATVMSASPPASPRSALHVKRGPIKQRKMPVSSSMHVGAAALILGH